MKPNINNYHKNNSPIKDDNPMMKPNQDKCESCKHNVVWHYNETVRKKGTENVKIMDICRPCFTKITGAK